VSMRNRCGRRGGALASMRNMCGQPGGAPAFAFDDLTMTKQWWRELRMAGGGRWQVAADGKGLRRQTPSLTRGGAWPSERKEDVLNRTYPRHLELGRGIFVKLNV
jgi:hypothetical protein